MSVFCHTILMCLGTSDCFCDVFPSFWGNARHLQCRRIKNCRGIESILSVCSCFTFSSLARNEEEIEVDDQLGESRNAPFQSVEILMLSHLQDLRGLIRSRKLGRLGFGVIAPHGTFSNLRKLGISFCDKMNSVFTPGLQLPHLEEITVKFCDEIKEIFDHEGVGTISSRNNHDSVTKLHKLWLSSSLLEFESICQGMGIRFFRNNHNMPFILPKLKKLQLESLPKLGSICEGMMVCASIEEIHVSRCPKLKRLPFFLPLDNNGQASTPMTLKEINVHRDWWESLEWDPPNVKAVLQPFLRFDKIWEVKTIR